MRRLVPAKASMTPGLQQRREQLTASSLGRSVHPPMHAQVTAQAVMIGPPLTTIISPIPPLQAVVPLVCGILGPALEPSGLTRGSDVF